MSNGREPGLSRKINGREPGIKKYYDEASPIVVPEATMLMYDVCDACGRSHVELFLGEEQVPTERLQSISVDSSFMEGVHMFLRFTPMPFQATVVLCRPHQEIHVEAISAIYHASSPRCL
jgi:hypothetical protein